MTETEAHYYYLEIECAKRLRIIDQRDERIVELEAKLKAVEDILGDAPELNMSNYDFHEVADLNNAVIEAYQIITTEEKS